MRRPRLDFPDIQGNVLRAYRFGHAAHVFVNVADAPVGRRWVDELRRQITTAAAWSEKPKITHNVAFTYAGLRALDLPEVTLASFPPAFRAGMAGRAALLGDHGPSAPDQWEPGLGTGAAHVLISLYAGTETDLLARLDELHARIGADDALTIVHEQRAAELAGMREQFGFDDGFGQPAIAGVGPQPAAQGMQTRLLRRWKAIGAGAFVHGYPDSDGLLPRAPIAPFDRNGTYMVYRKLAQDVVAFRALTAEAGAQIGDEELAAAKILGRWRDGTPLVLSPTTPDPSIASDPRRINAFEYHDDPRGQRCPLGAHVRRANPRDALGFGYSMSAPHRIIRRGMPYGPPLPPGAPDDGIARGLLFICFNADLEEQFEFIQSQWCNDGNAFALGTDRDAVVGPGGGKMTIQASPPRFLAPLPRVVTVRGGEYLFVPGMRALRAISASVTSDNPSAA